MDFDLSDEQRQLKDSVDGCWPPAMPISSSATARALKPEGL